MPELVGDELGYSGMETSTNTHRQNAWGTYDNTNAARHAEASVSTYTAFSEGGWDDSFAVIRISTNQEYP